MKICFVSYAPNPTTQIRGYGFARFLEGFGFKTRVLKFWEKTPKPRPSLPALIPLFNRSMILAKQIIRYAPDLIYTLGSFPSHAIVAITSHKVLKNHLIFDLDDWELKHDVITNKLIRHCENYLLKHSKATIVASNELMKYVSALGASNIHYIPTGVDISLFDPKNFPKEKFEKKVLIFTGARTPEYWDNISLLLKAIRIVMEENKNFELWMIGRSEGRIDDAIRKLSAKWFIRLRLRKAVKFERLPHVLAQADIALHPLVDNFFNRCKSPTKLFEYMSMKLPVVSSNVGEASTMIKHEINGLLCKNENEFANNIIALLDDEKFAKRIGRSARKTVEQKYSLQILSKRLANIITKSC